MTKINMIVPPTFSVTEYINTIEARLRAISRSSKVAFAVWCADYLYNTSQEFIAAKCGNETTYSANTVLNVLWTTAESRDGNKRDSFDRELTVVSDCTWDEDELSGGEIAMHVCAQQAIEALMLSAETLGNDSPVSAARCAEAVVNYLDCILGEKYGNTYTDQVFNDPLMTAEIASQSAMLEYLTRTGMLTRNDRTLFRGRSKGAATV